VQVFGEPDAPLGLARLAAVTGSGASHQNMGRVPCAVRARHCRVLCAVCYCAPGCCEQGGFVFRSGKTVAGEGWEHYSTGGIFINVDTTAAGVTSDDVTYTTSMMGTSSHWMSTGSSCVYPWPGRTYRTGFRVYIYQASLTVAQAREYGYQVSWVGQERR
jgi:hypothetical protein